MREIVHHVPTKTEAENIRDALADGMARCLVEERTNLRDHRLVHQTLDARGFPRPFILELGIAAVSRARELSAQKFTDALEDIAAAAPASWGVQPTVLLLPDRG